MMHNWYGLNRTICNVFAEMRECYRTYNFSVLLSLIEEAQVMANRMEQGLADLKDLESIHADLSQLRREIAKLQTEKQLLEPEKD